MLAYTEMTDSKLFESWRDAEAHVSSRGFERGDPLSMDLRDARRIQMEYLLYLAEEDFQLGDRRDLEITGPHGPLKMRLLKPQIILSTTPILYLRGGGWWVGNLETSARTMAYLCRSSGMPVIGIDYRLAPEHRFPVQLDEIVTAGRWLAQHGQKLGVDATDGLLMWGESAGATLAVCAARELLTHGIPCIGHLLNYGNFLGPHPGLRPVSRWVWNQYLSDSLNEPPSRAKVFTTNGLDGVRRAWLGCGTEDNLLIDTQVMQRELQHAGISHQVHFSEGMPHGFVGMSRFLRAAQESIESAALAAQTFAVQARICRDVSMQGLS